MSDIDLSCPYCFADVDEPEGGWDEGADVACPKCGGVSEVESEYISNDAGWLFTLAKKESP